MTKPVLCFGEVLWDVFPSGQFLGGAPLNVAYHLHALGRDVRIASRLGTDELAQATLTRLAEAGLSPELLQADATLPTGRVLVELLDTQTPRYDIEKPAAWDAIELTPDLLSAARAAGCVVFGSLAQRDVRSRTTLAALLKETSALRVFDINLRPPFIDRDVVETSLRACNFLKINDEELRVLGGWFGLPAGERPAATELSRLFDCETICVTRGASGAALLRAGDWFEHGGFRVTAVDPVGAGDAFLAGLLDATFRGASGADALTAACALGAYVATQKSATPSLDRSAINQLITGATAPASH